MKIGKKFNKVVAGSIPAGSFKHLQQICKYNEMVKRRKFLYNAIYETVAFYLSFFEQWRYNEQD